jgi:pyrroline-5-carboxylate reductase
MTLAGPILLVGCGKMGAALLRGWLGRGMKPDAVRVVEPNAAALDGLAVWYCAEAGGLPADFVPRVVLLAVKPQVMEAALPAYRRFARPGTVFLSIAAGRTIASMARALGADAAIVRSIPNTPAAVGRNITVACANPAVDEAGRALCDALLAAVGEVAWVEDEALIDPVTAVSGNGPAYVFLLIECMAEAGRAVGLPAELAMRLARVTVSGAGELARQSPEPAAQLRQNVTSPGGTTEAALAVLMAADGIQPVFDRALAAAVRRARELAG